MIEILIILGLILLNGVFSMAEMALVSSRKTRLETQAAKDDKKADEALKLINKPDAFFSTVQIGITLIGILTGIFSSETLKADLALYLGRFTWIGPFANGAATVIIVIILTYFTLVLGELVPKRIGLSRPEGIAKLVATPMRIVSTITYPFVWLLSKSTFYILKFLKIGDKDNQVTEEEIRAIIHEGTEQGTIEEAEQEIIERVFHLGDRNITSMMTHRNDIVWFNLNNDEEKIKETIISEPHSVYPVCEDNIDDIKGVVSVKDLYLHENSTPLVKIMQPTLFVPENNTAYHVLERFKETKIHCCFVVDEYGSLLGMITLNDILEAIVGDIPQPDGEDYEIVEREDGTYFVDGQIPFYDFLSTFEKTDWINEGEQDFDTLAGFILHQVERIPFTGDKLEWRGFTFEIADMDGHRIDKVLVTISETIKKEMEE
ncbi:MAG: hemolysin family protein [Chitinophagaceae bacterium]|nr:hemolysin family protein [Chitinophagaceae bacterium]